MRKALCTLLIINILLSGCAGREANLVQVKQFGDEDKSCKQLITEMNYIESEIARLLPKSDKTGRNIACGATGLIFIVPLFFMDLKQGEKKEVEAYQNRYNRLLRIAEMKNCKINSAIVKATPKEEKTSKASENQFKKCENCGSVIGNLEKPHVFEKHTVCPLCYEKLTAQANAEIKEKAKE